MSTATTSSARWVAAVSGALLLAGASLLALLMSIDVCLGTEGQPPVRGSVRHGACSGGDVPEVGFAYYVGAVAVAGLVLLVVAVRGERRGRRLATYALLPAAAVLLVPLVLRLLPT